MSVFSGQIDILARAARVIPPPLSSSIETASLRQSWPISDGTAPRGARRMVSGRTSVAPLTGNQLLLTNAVDRLGDTFDFETVRALIVRNRSDSHSLSVYGSIMSVIQGDLSYSITVRPGGTLVIVAPEDGYSVTPSVTDGLGFEPIGGEVEYDYIIIGT